MVSQLPKWVESGAFLLALVAGFVNAIGLLSFEHQSVSHLSGISTLLGAALIDTVNLNTLHLFLVILSFLIGAMLSGLLLNDSALKLGKHYETVLILEAVLLFVSMCLLINESSSGHFFASAACGLQNAMVTTYSGAVIRTTHVTGIFTDLGIMLGQWLRGQTFDKRKATLFIVIILGFIGGGVLGGALYDRFQFWSLLLPIAFCLILAFSYKFYKVISKQVQK